jgi:hypothetical protein
VSTDGPEIEIYPSQYRVIRGRRNRRNEPPIYWKNLWRPIVFTAFLTVIALIRTQHVGDVWHWLTG